MTWYTNRDGCRVAWGTGPESQARSLLAVSRSCIENFNELGTLGPHASQKVKKTDGPRASRLEVPEWRTSFIRPADQTIVKRLRALSATEA